MLRPQLQSLIEISLPTGHRLSGQRRDQIKVDIFEAGFTKLIKGRMNVCSGVSPAQLFQLVIVECLRTKAGPIDSQPSKFTECFAFGGSTGAPISGDRKSTR